MSSVCLLAPPQLSALNEMQQTAALDLLPSAPDLQAGWLLLLYSASPRAHYALRGVRPELTEQVAPPRRVRQPVPGRPIAGPHLA